MVQTNLNLFLVVVSLLFIDKPTDYPLGYPRLLVEGGDRFLFGAHQRDEQYITTVPLSWSHDDGLKGGPAQDRTGTGVVSLRGNL